MYCVGLDVGGTKCAVSLGEINGSISILERNEFPTSIGTPETVLLRFCEYIDKYVKEYKIAGIGVSCGGPLDSKTGVIINPPNLLGWENIKIKQFFENKYSIKTYLQNDANACAVAEWKFGAGKGCNNVVFLTFGTGLGAGLILNGKLYSGTNDNAGEAGHIRLSAVGPVGYGKAGSFEGFCSGGGIKKLCLIMIDKELKKGNIPEILSAVKNKDEITAKLIAERARTGDKFCKKVYDACAEKLGYGLSVLIDILNPEVIILGGIYMRSSDLLTEKMQKIIDKEALPLSGSVCRILPAGLKENIGDYAALSVAEGDF